MADDAPLALVALAGKAGVLEAQGQLDAAIGVLADAVTTYGEVPSLLNMLGDGLRRASRFEEAVDVYSRAIAALDNPEAPAAWSLYFARATALERADRWPEAEADLRLSLTLAPEQPMVLNMLGYSLVDRGLALEEALGMIERAMEQRPDDGYITDSLGWAFYRMGRYDEAVSVMLDAVLLVPGEGVLNDHYGDVLWMVGRKREAAFQWQRALDSRATDIDRPRIEAKLARGLDAVLEEEGNGNQ
ncbi:MAG: tetratricopeptide repeat protein [Paracoccaceae bacterium]